MTLFRGIVFQTKIELGGYNRSQKVYTIDLSKGDIIFSYSSEILLQTTGRASVLIALECEFPENEIKRPSRKEPTEVMPVLVEDLTHG